MSHNYFWLKFHCHFDKKNCDSLPTLLSIHSTFKPRKLEGVCNNDIVCCMHGCMHGFAHTHVHNQKYTVTVRYITEAPRTRKHATSVQPRTVVQHIVKANP